jgi:hypothetical protein
VTCTRPILFDVCLTHTPSLRLQGTLYYFTRLTSPSSVMANSTLSPPHSTERPHPDRAHTAPENMATNGHFASVGQNGHANFENGVQVVDEDKEFK